MAITRNKYIDVVKSYLGAPIGSARHKQAIDYFNKVRPDGWAMNYTAPWCAAFASGCAIQAFGTSEAQEYYPLSANCGVIVNKAIRMGIWVENDAFTPKAGDWIIYDWDDSGLGDDTSGADHVGVVIKVEKGVITIIEGNWAGKVSQREIKINSRYIRGFVTPKYTEEVKSEPDKRYVEITSYRNCYDTPKKANKIMQVPEGSKVYVTKRSGKWLYIESLNGWICETDSKIGMCVRTISKIAKKGKTTRSCPARSLPIKGSRVNISLAAGTEINGRDLISGYRYFIGKGWVTDKWIK